MHSSEHRGSKPAITDAAEKGLARVIACGSVDDGKSTLMGRLLYDTNFILDDQLAALERDSRKYGTTGDKLDFALLLDSLEAERAQSITIDVAFRYFATRRRAFIVADAPGHEQYTRNMATGASNSDIAVILIDARKGILTQTRRHTAICSILGVQHVVLAVNKIDLIGYARDTFEQFADEYRTFASRLGFRSIQSIPVCAPSGDNVVDRSRNTPWYRGPTLLEYLEEIDVASDLAEKPFRFAVQWVNRPNLDFRGYAGTVASGAAKRGDSIVVAQSGATSTITQIVTADGDLDETKAGDAVSLVLAEEIDVARGDLIVHPQERPEVVDQFAANLLWMGKEPLLPGRSYLMRIGAHWVLATVSTIKHRLDLNQLEEHAARILKTNEIGFCNIETASMVAFDSYQDNRETGAFILVDRSSNETVAAGMISFALRRATNIHRELLAVEKTARARMKGQAPCIVWFTGLPASGKSTIARIVEAQLHAAGYHTYMLDGDNLRHGLNRDLGFTDADRVENIRRVGQVAKLFVDSGLIVLCAFISPFRAERAMVRGFVEANEFIEIFVDASLQECMRRDPKGLYAKARAGTIKNFTGFDSPYEEPIDPELVMHTATERADKLAAQVIEYLRTSGHLG